MTDKQTYWIATAEGTHARVTGAEERDRWIPRGWREVGEPADTDFVWMRHDGIELPGRFPYGARESWRAMEWEFSAPPEPVDVTKDPRLFDQPTEAPKQTRSAAAEAPTSKPAAGTDKNARSE